MRTDMCRTKVRNCLKEKGSACIPSFVGKKYRELATGSRTREPWRGNMVMRCAVPRPAQDPCDCPNTQQPLHSAPARPRRGAGEQTPRLWARGTYHSCSLGSGPGAEIPTFRPGAQLCMLGRDGA